MSDFQNVGNFDAGVFTPKLGGVAPVRLFFYHGRSRHCVWWRIPDQ